MFEALIPFSFQQDFGGILWFIIQSVFVEIYVTHKKVLILSAIQLRTILQCSRIDLFI